MAGDMVLSSVVQESVSKVSSFLSGKLEEKPSRGHIIARLEMALTRVKFALERTREWQITYVALLQQRAMLSQFYREGTDLLNKLNLQPVDDSEAITQWAAGSSFLQWILSLIGLSKKNISSSILQKFEWYADCADKFVTVVESSCPLRHDTFRYPLESQLLQGKILMHEMVKGRQSRRICISPVFLEGRGVEAVLFYSYKDRLMPGKSFDLKLGLRISEGTNIVGTAVRCLQLLSSNFKFVTESAVQEITLLSDQLHDSISYSSSPPKGCGEEDVKSISKFSRKDPLCCTHNVDSSLGSFFGLPEAVNFMVFSGDISVHSSNDEVTINPSLHLRLVLVPHLSLNLDAQLIYLGFEGKAEKHVDGCIQHMEEIVRSKAIHCLVGQPGPAKYDVHWWSSHGIAHITLEKSRAKRASLEPAGAVPKPIPRATKRKRY